LETGPPPEPESGAQSGPESALAPGTQAGDLPEGSEDEGGDAALREPGATPDPETADEDAEPRQAGPLAASEEGLQGAGEPAEDTAAAVDGETESPILPGLQNREGS
jgi:hypothetical protein